MKQSRYAKQVLNMLSCCTLTAWITLQPGSAPATRMTVSVALQSGSAAELAASVPLRVDQGEWKEVMHPDSTAYAPGASTSSSARYANARPAGLNGGAGSTGSTARMHKSSSRSKGLHQVRRLEVEEREKELRRAREVVGVEAVGDSACIADALLIVTGGRERSDAANTDAGARAAGNRACPQWSLGGTVVLSMQCR